MILWRDSFQRPPLKFSVEWDIGVRALLSFFSYHWRASKSLPESYAQFITPSCVLTLLLGAFLWWGLWSWGSWNFFILLGWALTLWRTLKAQQSTTLLNESSLCTSLTGFGFCICFFSLTKTLSDMFCPKTNFASPAALFAAFFELKEQQQNKKQNK